MPTYDWLTRRTGQIGALVSKGPITIGSIKEVRYQVDLTNAQIKAMRATPITIIPSQGTGTLVVPTRGALILNAGTNALTETAANIAWRYVGQATGVLATTETTGFIDQTTDRVIFPLFNANDLMFAKTVCEGLGIEIFNNGAGEFAGNAANDATMRVELTAFVFSTGW